ncbi:POXA3b laccase small subunit [Mycena belliarum]|uniref:POXA3b laccase small subunit n=1 Tax=Mycena belliarum TaxID=1033014 RepID=A0AAD6XH08_9AGAR|nr:POXA3b laccase small subunit [Mycena belliae]
MASASSLTARQTSNTNEAINKIVSDLDIAMHKVGPKILTLQAQQKFSDATIGEQMRILGTAFFKADVSLARTPVSSGSTTVRPTNEDISVIYGEVMQLFSSHLSGVIPTGAVPHFSDMVKILDPIVANATLQLNITSPGSLIFVKRVMVDARQFLASEGFNSTSAALGYPI